MNESSAFLKKKTISEAFEILYIGIETSNYISKVVTSGSESQASLVVEIGFCYGKNENIMANILEKYTYRVGKSCNCRITKLIIKCRFN